MCPKTQESELFPCNVFPSAFLLGLSGGDGAFESPMHSSTTLHSFFFPFDHNCRLFLLLPFSHMHICRLFLLISHMHNCSSLPSSFFSESLFLSLTIRPHSPPTPSVRNPTFPPPSPPQPPSPISSLFTSPLSTDKDRNNLLRPWRR